MNDKIQSALENIQKEINALYGFHDGIPRINYGPCGVFAKIFYDEWNALFPHKVTLCFIMTLDRSECDHIVVKLPTGELYDGGIGIHTDAEYQGRFIIDEMIDYNEQTLEKWSYGLDREYPRFCPNFNRDEVQKIVHFHLKVASRVS